MCITLCCEFASRSFFLRCSKILTSMRAWWWNLFLFLQETKVKVARCLNKENDTESEWKNAGCNNTFVHYAEFSRIIARSESQLVRWLCTCISAYLIILMAMCCPVLWSSARITWPKLPLPITSRISYLRRKKCTYKLSIIYSREKMDSNKVQYAKY